MISGTAIIAFIILIFSAILHEIAHGVVADWFGDDTARLMGRITLNPIPHIDLYFTILVPLLLMLSGSPVILGAAKPVPVNYFRLTNYRWGVFAVSIAGVITNFFLAFVATLPVLLKLPMNDFARGVLFEITIINVFLGIINLIPIPPIDGSKVFAALLGTRAINKIVSIEMRGILGILPFIIIIYVLLFSNVFGGLFGTVQSFFLNLYGLG